MSDFLEEFTRPAWLSFPVIAARLLMAAVLRGREGAAVDPLRAVEAVTAGLALLAAGTIMFSRGEVQGLTIGAGLWLAGAVGLSARLGLWQIAALGTLLALAVLVLMYWLSPGIAADKTDAAGGKGAAKGTGTKPSTERRRENSGLKIRGSKFKPGEA